MLYSPIKKAFPRAVITYLLSGAFGVSGFVAIMNPNCFSGFR